MQHMQDKEFDNLFKDKFRDAEIEPSANLWANIEKELEPKKKRTFPIYWMAAATIAIAFTALLMFQNDEVTVLRGKGETAAEVKPSAKTDPIVSGSATTGTTPEHATASLGKNEVKAPKESNSQVITPNNNPVENNLPKNQVAVQPNLPNDHLPIKQQDPKPINVEPIKEVVTVEAPTVTAQATTKTNSLDAGEIAEHGNTERKGIRNVGDLVNYVVDKVDKRDKKLVRFNTDEDDNSSIIGINIGFLKLNKKNKDR
jgi:hypothetical protein